MSLTESGTIFQMLIRPATAQDISAICEIENQEIEHGFANFALEPVSVEGRTRQFLEAEGQHPWFVAQEGKEIFGFARASAWKSRGAYMWSAEIGVYVKPGHQGKGIGKLLYAELFPAMEAVGIRTILAGIALPNDASVRLHESFGMERVGTLPCVGFKHGEWRDVGYWAKHLGSGPPSSC
ncbi:MAG: N-acetyltransferase family protein [Fimbriimonas sp.]